MINLESKTKRGIGMIARSWTALIVIAAVLALVNFAFLPTISANYGTLDNRAAPNTALPSPDPADKSGGNRLSEGYIGLASVLVLLLVALALYCLILRPQSRLLVHTLSCLMKDVAASRQAILFDPKTGLPTRKNFIAQLRQDTLDHDPSRPLAIIHFDINRLKDINDIFGRDVGDLCIEHFAKTLGIARAPKDRLARISVDEFVLATSCSEDELQTVVTQYQRLIEAPTVIDGRMISVTCSMGMAHGTLTECEALLVDADLALDHAKRGGVGSHAYYTKGMREGLKTRRTLAEGLKLAIQNDEIEPFFQPQVDAKTGDVVGFEALVRWRRPKIGILAPIQFLAIAEDANLIGPISRIMIKKSLLVLKRWRDMGFNVPQISINFTALDLREADFVDSLLFDVDRAGLQPKDLCVELLESAMIENEHDPVIKTLATLTKHGFSVELDDFGTGHASISNLHRIKVTGMKIDRSFVIRLHEHPEQQKLTFAMLSLAKALDICSLAEGVESEAEREVLVKMGCQRLQGFGIARPMSATDATAWLDLYQQGEAGLLLRKQPI